MEEAEGRGERGHAKGPPGRGRRAGPSEGRAEAAPRRAHTRTHALPLHPRPLPARGAARRPRGTVQPVGDCRQLQGRPWPSPSFLPARGTRQPGPDGACKPAAQGIASAGARAASPFPTQRTRKSAAAGADLAWEGNRVSLVSLLPGSLPPPPSSAAWNCSGARPVGRQPEPPRVTASRQSRRGGPRPPTAELREVCHTSRGATGWHGNGAAEPWPLALGAGRQTRPLGRPGEGRAEERVSAYIL